MLKNLLNTGKDIRELLILSANFGLSLYTLGYTGEHTELPKS